MTEDVFHPAPEGMLSERVDLDDFHLTLGVVHPEGGDLCVAAWDGRELRTMTPEEARRYADGLIASGYAVPLAPVISAVRDLARRADEISMGVIFKRAGKRVWAKFAEMPAEGHA